MKKILLMALVMILASCAHNPRFKNFYKLAVATESDHRPDDQRNRDVYRNPVETLHFFEVAHDMKVVEIGPGGGWYTRILGPFLKDQGELHLAIFSEESKRSYAPRLNKEIKELTADKKHYGKVHFSVLEAPIQVGPVAADNSVDRVLTFRNVHNWMKDGQAKEAFMSFYKALKPGGILGVVEHRTRSNKKQDPKALSGYVREDYVIELAKSVGFEFMAKSEVNANYNDNADHPKGVWTLPPRLRLGEKDQSKYQAIGESDRMTIKFMKPLK